MTPRTQNIPNWRDINPRLGVSWDLFGNAKTALKFTTGRYINQEVAGTTRLLNPMRLISATDTRTWTDANDRFDLWLCVAKSLLDYTPS